MREKLGALLVGATAAVALIAAGPALAVTYCVHQTGFCDTGTVDEHGNLQQALMDAESADSTVSIGPGTYTRSGGFGMSTPHNVHIAGAGRGRTILKATGSASEVLVLEAPADSTLSGVSVVIDSHAGTGLGIVTATADDIEAVIDPATAAPGAIAAELISGAVIRDSTLTGSATGALIDAGSESLLDHDVITGSRGVEVKGAPARLQRSAVSGGYGVVVHQAGADLAADDDVITTTGAGPGLDVYDSGSATVRSATVVGSIGAAATASGSGVHTALTLLDSIIWNAVEGLNQGQSAGGTATLTANFDDFDGMVEGAPSMSSDINADPLFFDPAAGDFHLPAGSPAVDAGGDCATTCQTVLDFAGVTRPIDGNGDGVAVRDMGAFEYAHQTPIAAAFVDRGSALTGELLAFSGTGSSDPDPGDALTYGWSFDDGGAASGQDVTHAFTTAGSHTATLTVTDPTGLTATAAATVTVSAPPVVPDTVAPSLTKVSLSPSTFLVASGSTAVSAKRHHGTRIRFTLSEPAKVVASFQRCVTRVRQHHKTCHYVSAGSLTRRSEPNGKDAIAFSGRVGKHRLARGHYRMHLRATDSAGNRSKQKTASFTVL